MMFLLGGSEVCCGNESRQVKLQIHWLILSSNTSSLLTQAASHALQNGLITFRIHSDRTLTGCQLVAPPPQGPVSGSTGSQYLLPLTPAARVNLSDWFDAD